MFVNLTVPTDDLGRESVSVVARCVAGHRRTLPAAAFVAPVLVSAQKPVPPPENFKAEKCYGLARAGQNDCASTGNNSCGGTSKINGDPRAWIYVPAGYCTLIRLEFAPSSCRAPPPAPNAPRGAATVEQGSVVEVSDLVSVGWVRARDSAPNTYWGSPAGSPEASSGGAGAGAL